MRVEMHPVGFSTAQAGIAQLIIPRTKASAASVFSALPSILPFQCKPELQM
jgi:hypothetical protein